MTDPVHFFDLYSDLPGPSKSWSLNTLKVRTVLNFKGIPYTQSWMSYPDVKPLIQGLGLPPNEKGLPYTLPTIIHSSVKSNPNGALMDSAAIVKHLDQVFPSPSIFPSGEASHALVAEVEGVLDKLKPNFFPLIVANVAEHLDPRGQAYFNETRAEWFGKPVPEIRPTDAATLESMWKATKTECLVLIDMLNREKGPFFEGEKASYADLMVVSYLAFIERFERELFNKILPLGKGEVKTLYEACLPWLEGQGVDKEWVVKTE
ncbi:hypothetical protein BDV18DRAFT_129715 [Aspergillus unguis]